MRPRDWLPRYPAGDPRNEQHRADYDDYRSVFPNEPPWNAQTFADTRARIREQPHSQVHVQEKP